MLRLFMIDDGVSISSESVKAPEGIFNKKIVRISKYVDVHLKLEIGMLVCMFAKIFNHKRFVEGFADMHSNFRMRDCCMCCNSCL